MFRTDHVQTCPCQMPSNIFRKSSMELHVLIKIPVKSILNKIPCNRSRNQEMNEFFSSVECSRVYICKVTHS